MKLRINYLAFVFFLLIGTISGQTWKVFESIEGKFSILTPGLMQTKTATVTTTVGEFDVHTFYLNPNDSIGNYLYVINYYDLEPGLIPQDSLELLEIFLKNTMDQSISDLNGQLMYNTPVSIGIHKGLMWRSKSDSGVVKCRAFIINDRFYMLQVFSIESKSLNHDVDRFLESFTLRGQ